MSPAPPVRLHVLWANSSRYGIHFVAAWTDSFVEHWPEAYRMRRREAEEHYEAFTAGEGERVEGFFITLEELPRPAAGCYPRDLIGAERG